MAIGALQIPVREIFLEHGEITFRCVTFGPCDAVTATPVLMGEDERVIIRFPATVTIPRMRGMHELTFTQSLGHIVCEPLVQ